MRRWLLSVVLVLSTGCDSLLASDGRVRVCLLDEAGRPASGAAVFLDGRAMLIGASGCLDVARAEGPVALEGMSVERLRWSARTTVRESAIRDLGAIEPIARWTEQLPGTGSIAGCLSRAEGDPAASARVWGTPGGVADALPVTSTMTDGGGCFVITGLPAGAVELFAQSADDAQSGRWSLATAPDLRFELGTRALSAETGCIAGRALQGTQPALVEVSTDHAGLWAWSDEAGRFALRAPVGACFDVHVEALNVETATIVGACARPACADEHTVTVVASTTAEDLEYYELEPMPRPVALAGVAAKGTDVYVVSGWACDRSVDPDESPTCGNWSPWHVPWLQRLDLRSGTWTTEQDVPTPRVGGTAAILGDTLYFIGGGRAQAMTGSCSPNRWLDRGQPRYTWRGQAMNCNTKVAEGYDLVTKTWHPVEGSTIATTLLRALVTGDAISVFGGVSDGGADGYRRDINIYKPELDAWSAHHNRLRFPAYNIMACRVGASTYVTGGESFTAPRDTADPPACHRPLWVLDDRDAQWTDLGDAPAVYAMGDCASFGRFVYFPGRGTDPDGIHHDYAMSARFDTETRTWFHDPEVRPGMDAYFRTVATPHGMVHTSFGNWNPEQDQGRHDGRAIAAIGHKFAERARQRYARARLIPLHVDRTDVILSNDTTPCPWPAP